MQGHAPHRRCHLALVVLIHHYGKNAAVGLRGASASRRIRICAVRDGRDRSANRQCDEPGISRCQGPGGRAGALTPFILKPVELGLDDFGRPWGSMVAVAGSHGEPHRTGRKPSEFPASPADHPGHRCPRAYRFPTVRRGASLSFDLVRDGCQSHSCGQRHRGGAEEALRKQFIRKLT